MLSLDAVLLSVLPVLIVMSVLAVVLPSLRKRGSWLGIGAAWVGTLVASLLVAVTHPDAWAVSCGMGLLRIGVTSFGAQIAPEPCTSANTLPLWLVALPPLVGIAILLAWVGRHNRPLPAALRAIGGLTALTVVIVGVGQVSPNAALLLVVAVGVVAYAWPRLVRHRAI